MKTKKNNKNDIHVIPDFKGKRKHKTSFKCWCRPKKVATNKLSGGRVWTHFINGSKRKKD